MNHWSQRGRRLYPGGWVVPASREPARRELGNSKSVAVRSGSWH